MPGCEATPGTDLPDSSEDSGDSTTAVPQLGGRRACCDAASLVQQAQNTVEMPSRSSATKWWIPIVQQRTDATPFYRQGRQHPRRGAVTNPSPESSEGDRDSTGSVPAKMVDVTVVPVHGCTSQKGRPRSHSCSLYRKTMGSLSPDARSREIGEHTCPPGLKHLVEKVETNTAMLKTMLLHSEE